MVRALVICLIAATVLGACASTQAMPPSGGPTTTLSPTGKATIYIAETERLAIDIAHLTWLYPGQGSILVSPIFIAAQVPSKAKLLRVELHGSDGRLLARQVLAVEASELKISIEFEIPRAPEGGRLSLSIDDALGRTVELSSIAVTLAGEGTSTIEPAQAISVLEITDPQQDAELNGGRLVIAGHAGIVDDPVHVEMLTSAGRVLAADDVYPDRETGQFSAELDYRLDEAGWVLVMASQTQNGAVTFLDSVEVWLAP